VHLSVAADDRTGALETAATLADRGAGGVGGVPVAVWPDQFDAAVETSVVDLATRHVDVATAQQRAASLVVPARAAHKIDSTLRGNWAAELAARHEASGRRVLLVPALPALGRVCVDGVVLADGRPVHESGDARAAPTSSRPTDHLALHGLQGQHLATIDEVERWLAGDAAAGVADAADQPAVEQIVAAWQHHPDVILAGTSAVIGAAAGSPTVTRRRVPDGPALVVVGSLNTQARRQVEAVVDAGGVLAESNSQAAEALASGEVVVVATEAVAGSVSAESAAAVTAGLADDVHRIMSDPRIGGCVVVIGGDTAAAVLGDDRVIVHGSVTPGSAWVVSPRFRQPVITRAGGFGDAGALVDLLRGTLQ
jgi:uncharacterized protein YgbK (DUF1537 family)